MATSVDRPAVTLLVPVYNEEESLPGLFSAMEAAAPTLPKPLEYVFINDGSADRSLELLEAFRSAHATVKVVDLTKNFGQHAAIMAGLREAEGEVVVTLDADLQNPPSDRQDPLSRRTASWMMNKVVGTTTGHYLHDYGCMLRAYSRSVVDAVNQCPERHLFLPVLANAFGRRVTEVEVAHAERSRGQTKYSWTKLWRLNLDLLTGISTMPLHWVSFSGLAHETSSSASAMGRKRRMSMG